MNADVLKVSGEEQDGQEAEQPIDAVPVAGDDPNLAGASVGSDPAPNAEPAEDPTDPELGRRKSARKGQGRTRIAKKFDFRQPKTLERNQLRSLQMILEAFVRPASSVLSANLRVPCRMEITELTQMPWETVLGELEDSGCISIVSVLPLPSKAIFYQGIKSALEIVDLRFGGGGDDIPDRQILTDIELGVILGVMQEVLAQLSIAFTPIYETRIGQISQEQSLQFVQVTSMNEMCVVARIDLKIDERPEHQTALILPLPLLRPMLEYLGSKGAAVLEQPLVFTNQLAERLQEVNLELRVVFSPTSLASGQIIDLRPGDVVRLTHRRGEPLDLVSGPVKITKVQPTQVGRRLACLVVEGVHSER